MDEQKMMAEIGKVYSALQETNLAVGKNTNKLDKLIPYLIDHVDKFNYNVKLSNNLLDRFNKYAKRQNVAILAGIGGFLYLCKKIQKLEDATKKE